MELLKLRRISPKLLPLLKRKVIFVPLIGLSKMSFREILDGSIEPAFFPVAVNELITGAVILDDLSKPF